MEVKEFVEAGLRCPACHSERLRSGYHEWQHWDSWICQDCGFRWMEDLESRESAGHRLIQALKNDTPEELKNRLIWVLHVARWPEIPLKNPKSSDATSYDEFIKGT